MHDMPSRDDHAVCLQLMLNVIRVAQGDGGLPIGVCVKLKTSGSPLQVAAYIMNGHGKKAADGAARKCDAALRLGYMTGTITLDELGEHSTDRVVNAVYQSLALYTKGGGILLYRTHHSEVFGALGVEGRSSQANHTLALRAARAMKLYQ